MPAALRVARFISRCCDIRFARFFHDAPPPIVFMHDDNLMGGDRELEQLKASRRRLAAIVAQSPVAVIGCDPNLRVTEWNPSAESIFGFSAAEALGHSLPDLVLPPAERDRHLRESLGSRGKSGVLNGIGRNIRKDGTIITCEWRDAALLDDVGATIGYVSVVENVTERVEVQREIEYLAFHDTLTGLANYRLLQTQLQAAVDAATERGRGAAVLFLDLDRFKNVNDSLGHRAGDQLIEQVADRLRTCVRGEDVVARLGGDEFVIVLVGLSRAEARSVATATARRLLQKLEQPFLVSSQRIFISGSIGLALCPEHGSDWEEAMKHSDIAMYQAKAAGGNGFVIYQSGRDELQGGNRVHVESELRTALASNHLVLHYQPQLDLATGQITATEALLRWLHPERGLIVPASFIGLSEETGFICDLGDWVLRTACQQAAEWRKEGMPALSIAINVSARQLSDRKFPSLIERALKNAGLGAEHLELEITESAAVRDLEATTAQLAALRALGVRIVIDDFGTGHSSLRYLKRLPVDVLKIDQSFIQQCALNDADAEIVKAILVLAHGMKMRVVAEGVENVEQFNFLRSLGCDRLQGYFVGRPVPAAGFWRNIALKPTA